MIFLLKIFILLFVGSFGQVCYPVCSTSCKEAEEELQYYFNISQHRLREICGNDFKDNLFLRYQISPTPCTLISFSVGNYYIQLYQPQLFSNITSYSDLYEHVINSKEKLSIVNVKPYTGKSGVFPDSISEYEESIISYGMWDSRSNYEYLIKNLQYLKEVKKCRCYSSKVLTIPENISLACKKIHICGSDKCISLMPLQIFLSNVRDLKQSGKIIAGVHNWPACSVREAQASDRVCELSLNPLPNTEFKCQSCLDNKNISSLYRLMELISLADTGNKYRGCVEFNKDLENNNGLWMFEDNLYNGKSEILHGLQENWKNSIAKHWMSQCINAFPMGQSLQSPSILRTPTTTTTTARTPITSLPTDKDEVNPGTQDDNDETNPKPPKRFDPCRLLINEVLPATSSTSSSFIELALKCPPGVNKKATILSGYQILILKSGTPSEIIAKIDLRGKALVLDSAATGRHRKGLFYTLGTGDVQLDFNSKDFVEFSSIYDKGIPIEEGKSFAIVLVYTESLSILERQATNAFSLVKVGENYLSKPLDNTIKTFIIASLQDVVVYGHPTIEVECLDFLNIMKTLTVDNEGYCEVLTIKNDETNDDDTPESFSRCSKSSLPMQIKDFLLRRSTPLSENNCPQNSNHHFNLQRAKLQSTAQKLIVNGYSFFQKAAIDSTLCEGKPVALTANALGISNIALVRVLHRWRSNTIVTPAKSSNRQQQTKFAQLDSFQIRIIREVIERFYKQNLAPTVHMIFEETMRRFKEDTTLRRSKNEDVEDFTCSKGTFRRMLRKLGYMYGRINQRAVILQRNDIVATRGKYLKTIRNNDALPSPKPVIYLDETWIDPFQRLDKGWIFKTDDPKLQKCYSYQNHKVGRGGRIIILHAGTKDGFIPGALLIREIEKNKETLDYHGNIAGDEFFKWFTKLLDLITGFGPSIIVMDNAPYHSQLEAPTSAARKAVMYDWLRENLPDGEKEQITPALRRWELWDILKKIRSTFEYGKIDRLAKSRGHTVARLNPYGCELNPIEYVWSDIKRNVRASNAHQNVKHIKEITKQIMDNYPAATWAKHVAHVKKLETKWWDFDGHYEDVLERNFVIRINDPEDDTDDEDDTDVDEENIGD